ncbi:hypothetical protein DQ04_03181080, partial [Trypanosoma grayi]|uniref:hypothetical protein n=1 Tax=Trypanosoma grayi TaxID=71804 RepID=UPI0004F42410
MSPFGNSRDANASNCGHCVESNHDDNERSASSPQEEYLEMDYASEIEECSRYTFSQLVHTYDMTVADECDTEERWLRHQQRAYARESADAHETWLERMRVQQEETAAGMYGAVSLRLLLGEARHRHLAHLR